MEQARPRPDFMVIGPANPPDPHCALRLLNWEFHRDLWDGSYDPKRPRRTRPLFVGDERLAYYPSILLNDRGLCLWSGDIVNTVRTLLPDPPADFIEAELRIEGWSSSLPSAFWVVMPHVTYHDVIDHAQSARLWPRPAHHADRIVLRPDFVPEVPFFGLDFLGTDAIALIPEFAEKLSAYVNFWHCWMPHVSEIRTGEHRPTQFPTPEDGFAESVRRQIALLREPRQAPEPCMPITMEQARTHRLEHVREKGSMALNGNRESWSRLSYTDQSFFIEHGDVDSNDSSFSRISADTAWSLIQSRVFEDMGLYKDAERMAVAPEQILARLKQIFI